MPTEAALLPPDEGVDRKQLRQVMTRFRAISAARLERVRALLPEAHRQFLDLLPLLLHLNHPSLPGYVSAQTPCGLHGYTPTPVVLELARRVALSFSYQRPAASEAQVHALYLMGSSGSLGHNDGSDLDLWICYPEQLDSAALALLQRKSTMLQQWAREQGIDAHLFLMNTEKFKRGQSEPLTGENCGSAQHYLLLDEFYRTGVLLAGRVPAWWLVPPAAEESYPEYFRELSRKRHVRVSELVDFGGIATVPEGEFVGAGIWQLYKAIASPYKSVLKLLLFEVYAARFPFTDCLSGDYKRAVYRGSADIDELDPYVMIYRRLEQHLLAREEPERLEIVRRCLYYKAGQKLSRVAPVSWQRSLMQRLAGEWGWSEQKLAMLDSRSNWKILEVGSERNELVRELTYSYRFLSEFARHADVSASIDAGEFAILGRRLYAEYERKAGKIEILNPGRALNVAEEELSFCALDTPSGILWAALPETVAPQGEARTTALRQSACFTELLAWCVVNGVIGERTRLSTREARDGLHRSELRQMIAELQQLEASSARTRSPGDGAFSRPARALHLLVFVNVAEDPLRESRAAGRQRVSSHTDSLGFSALHENLVLNIETLVCNSWGELVVTRYAGEEGLMRCLREHVQLLALDAGAPGVVVRCFCPSRAGPIAARVAELLEDVGACFCRGAGIENSRYVLAIGKRLQLLEHQAGVLRTRVAADLDHLYDFLGASLPVWSPLVIDRHALPGSSLRAIAATARAGSVSVFVELQGTDLELSVLDEHGSLFHARYRDALEGPALGAIDKFLASIRYRQNTHAASVAGPLALNPSYYRLRRDGARGSSEAQPFALPRATGSAAFLNVQAIVEPAEGDSVYYTVYCNGVAFAQRELGEEFQLRLARHVHSQRSGGGHYPIYLTDIDLSALAQDAKTPLQTIHYLQHKQALEQEIERALRERSHTAPRPGL